MRAYERFLNYVKIHTTSDENSNTTPSTRRQFDLAEILAEEMKKLGVKDVRVMKTVMYTGRFRQPRDMKTNLPSA